MTNSAEIGNTDPEDRNIIGHRGGQGILLSPGSFGTHIRGNYIGVDASGDLSLNGSGIGIQVDGAENTEIGLGTAGGENIIAGNGGEGIVANDVPDSLVILRNRIGVGASGTAIANGGAGIAISNSVGVRIGGTSGTVGNVISGNQGAGIST